MSLDSLDTSHPDPVCRWDVFWDPETKPRVIPFMDSLDRQYKYYRSAGAVSLSLDRHTTPAGVRAVVGCSYCLQQTALESPERADADDGPCSVIWLDKAMRLMDYDVPPWLVSAQRWHLHQCANIALGLLPGRCCPGGTLPPWRRLPLTCCRSLIRLRRAPAGLIAYC